MVLETSLSRVHAEDPSRAPPPWQPGSRPPPSRGGSSTGAGEPRLADDDSVVYSPAQGEYGQGSCDYGQGSYLLEPSGSVDGGGLWHPDITSPPRSASTAAAAEVGLDHWPLAAGSHRAAGPSGVPVGFEQKHPTARIAGSPPRPYTVERAERARGRMGRGGGRPAAGSWWVALEAPNGREVRLSGPPATALAMESTSDPIMRGTTSRVLPYEATSLRQDRLRSADRLRKLLQPRIPTPAQLGRV
jgi:hypothetical protein